MHFFHSKCLFPMFTMIGKCTVCVWVGTCECMCMCSTFETFPKSTDIIYMNSLLQFMGFATVNKEMCINTLHGIRDAVRRKCPKQWITNSWFLLYDNAPAHRSDLVKDFSSTNNVTTLQHSPYSPDLTLADFYLFSWHH
jgi:hypothetical protein